VGWSSDSRGHPIQLQNNISFWPLNVQLRCAKRWLRLMYDKNRQHSLMAWNNQGRRCRCLLPWGIWMDYLQSHGSLHWLAIKNWRSFTLITFLYWIWHWYSSKWYWVPNCKQKISKNSKMGCHWEENNFLEIPFCIYTNRRRATLTNEWSSKASKLLSRTIKL